MDRLDRKKRDKPTPVEQLGQEMIDAGNQLGPGTSYGKILASLCMCCLCDMYVTICKHMGIVLLLSN